MFVSYRQTIDELSRKIISHFEIKQQAMKGLKGLRINSLRKVLSQVEEHQDLSRSTGGRHSITDPPTIGVSFFKSTEINALGHSNATGANFIHIPKERADLHYFWQSKCQELDQVSKIGECLRD